MKVTNDNNSVVPPGISGKSVVFNAPEVKLEALANEVALLSLGDWEALKIKIDVNKFQQEIKQFDDEWVDYLPRTDRVNNRLGLAVTNLPGLTHRDNPSLAQTSYTAGRKVSEVEFNQPTDAYKKLTSLHPLLDLFFPLGRTFLIKSKKGGYFVPHRDHPTIPRDSFRIAVFLQGCEPLEYDWIQNDKKMLIEHGRPYYINTKQVHRTVSWNDNSIHLILNIPFNSKNVSKLIANLQHAH